MFESLDFVYIPAPDIESSVDYYKNILGGELLWKIHAYGVWVACIVLSDEEPYILLANHIEKNDIVLIYRVSNLEKTAFQLRSKGWKEEKRLEIPPGPCCTFRDPADNHIAIYEKLRPDVMKEFKGQIDVQENEKEQAK
jgi:catechol 2,3-dioxygenase-like lactoylglutathione lyase family enzyme